MNDIDNKYELFEFHYIKITFYIKSTLCFVQFDEIRPSGLTIYHASAIAFATP